MRLEVECSTNCACGELNRHTLGDVCFIGRISNKEVGLDSSVGIKISGIDCFVSNPAYDVA